jgi:MYXO-CTERM domain-containing protein
MSIEKTLAGLCLAITLLAPAIGAGEELFLSVNFEPPVHSTRAVGEVLEVPGAELMGNPGKPLLPQKTLYFLLPYGHKATDVRLEALVVEPLDGTYHIMPAQRPVPLSKIHLARPTAPDPAVYDREDAFPEKWMETGSIQFKHGYAVLPVILHPLSYHPRSGLVDRITAVTVVLETSPGGPISPRFRANPADTDRIMRLADEVTPVRSYRRVIPRGPSRLPSGDYQYVIIAPQAFVGLGDPNSLENLRDARIAGGLTARIETIEWIQANFDGQRPDGSQDDATRVRQFLTAAHDEWGTQYALLVGDADAGDVGGESGDNLMPVRGLWVDGGQGMRDFLPADMYYSCLDGNYDQDANGLYGEQWDGPGGGEVDLLAELYVGRAPADSAMEVQNFVAKTLAYENGAGNWLKEVWMLGEWLFEGPVWGGDFMDGIVDGTSAGGYTTLGFSSYPFYECQTLYDRDEGGQNSWDASNLLPILNNGPHIVNHLGHSATYWNMRLTITNVDGLLNTRPFLHYSQGCYNGSFDNQMISESGSVVSTQDCIAEHLLLGKHGAFATCANSRYGLGSYGSDGPSNRFHRQFWDAFFSEGKTTIGEAFADCKDDNATAFAELGNRWAGFTVNLLGDPAVALKKSINTTDPLLGLYPPGLSFFSRMGDPSPDPAELFVRNDGVGQLTYTAATDRTWIGLSANSGSAPQDLQVQVDTTGLAPGTHAGVITVSSPEAPNSPVAVPVEQIVIEVPELRLPHIETAPQIDGEIVPGEYDGFLQLLIDEEQNGDVVLYLGVAGNQLHLAIEDFTDLTDGDDEFIFLFDRDMDEQWPTSPGDEGAYWLFGNWKAFFIPFYNAGGGYETGNYSTWDDNPVGFDIQLNMQDGHRVYEASLDLDTSRLDVGLYGAFGLYFQVRDTLDWSIREVTGRWPHLVPEFDDQRFFGKLDLAPEGPRLDSTPTSLLFNCTVDGTPPDPATLSVFDREGGSIAYTAGTSPGWLSVAPAAGQAPGELTVSIDQSGVAVGDHWGTVIIEGNTWNSPYEIPVALRVWGVPAKLGVDPTDLHITAVENGPDPLVDLEISNLGGRPMEIALSASVPWISLSPDSDTIGPFGDRRVLVTADLSQLDIGSHPGQITVSGIMAADSPQTVSLQVDVVEERPVPPVEKLDLGSLDSALQVSWTCPDDPIVSGVLIRKKLGTPPDGPQFGDFVYDGREEHITDADLQNGTTYCYSAFAHDSAGRYAEPATACGIPGPNRKPPVPELLSPADGGVVPATPELVASTVVDPDGDVVTYTFVLLGSSDNPLDSATVEGSGSRVSWLPNAELQPEVSYRWQVEAVDSQGAHSGFAETYSFSIRTPTDGGPDGGEPGDTEPDCGCGYSNTASPWLLLLVAGLTLLRRRRKR